LYPTRILLATDGSEESASAVRTAVELANSTGSELHVVHAISTAPQRPYPRHFERARSKDMLQRKRVAALVLLDSKVRQVKKMGGIVADSYYREGDPSEEVRSR
jgi:nucleotide-binding universal stress UspA family protein